MDNCKSILDLINSNKEYYERNNYKNTIETLMAYHEINNKQNEEKKEKSFFPGWNHKGREEEITKHFNYYFQITDNTNDWVKASDIKATFVYSLADGDDDYLDYFLVSIMKAKKWKDERGLIYCCVKAIPS